MLRSDWLPGFFKSLLAGLASPRLSLQMLAALLSAGQVSCGVALSWALPGLLLVIGLV